MITLRNVLNAYSSLKTKGPYISPSDYGRHIGYLEACMVQFGYMELDKDEDIVRKVLSKGTWYRKEKKETVSHAILRMTEKLLKDNKLL